MIDYLSRTSAHERENISGLSEERTDIIIAGSLVIEQLLELVNAEELIISGCGLREGVFFRYYDK